jgi:phospholipid/cholesterol/gamma-HCH transport system ATP-binding protein
VLGESSIKGKPEMAHLNQFPWIMAAAEATLGEITTVSTTVPVIEHDQASPVTSTVERVAIEFRRVSISFDDKQVLRDVSFTLRRGETIIITGTSDSGKTVLLRLTIGLLRPDSGQIFVGGREIENLKEDELLAIRGGEMGLVFQDETLFTGLSVYDNAAYRLAEHGWSEEDTERAVGEVLLFVGLKEDADKFPEELSGGMRRRLEFARAFIGYPSIMLYDEPMSGLDPLTATQILDLSSPRARPSWYLITLCNEAARPDSVPRFAARARGRKRWSSNP